MSHNTFKKLVENENDIVGMVAYSLYKEHKIDYIQRYKDEYSREPDDNEMLVFYSSMSSEKMHLKYLEQAEDLLETLYEQLYQMERKELDDELLIMKENIKNEEIIKVIRSELLEKNKNSFWKNVGASLTAGLITIIISILGWFMVAKDDSNSKTKLIEETKEKVIHKFTNN